MPIHFLLQSDAAQIFELARSINDQSGDQKIEINGDLVKKFAYGAAGDLCPMQAVIGGITAQEVMKVIQRRF